MKKRTLVLIFFCFVFVSIKAQPFPGIYIGEANGIKVIVKNDSVALLSYRYETSVAFEFECSIIKKGDSTFQLENLKKTTDKIVFLTNNKKKNSIPEISFFVVDRAHQNNPVDINYEIVPSSNFRPSKNINICFLYNQRIYCYAMAPKASEIKIFIDGDNSFLITNWKIRGDKLIPYIHGKEVSKWILRKS